MRLRILLHLAVLAMLAQQPSVDSRPVILALGDSLTAGYGVERGFSYPEQLQKRLDSRGYHYRVINMGLSGDTSRGARSRMNRALAFNPAIVILEIGGNDRSNGLSPAQTEANLEQMILFFKNGGTTVILAGRTLSGREDPYAKLANKHHLALISNFLKDVAGDPSLTIGDGIHPNAEGYEIVTDTVMQILEPLL